MKLNKPKIPKKYQPEGFEILHEDPDIIVVNKYAGTLSVAALWNKDNTVHSALNTYVRKGNPKSSKCVYVVHRLDQATSGIMVFAKTDQVQLFLKNNWTQFDKTYFAITNGHFKSKSGIIESYLTEDEDYHIHSSKIDTTGKLARTQYEVVAEFNDFSLVKVKLLTGKKNQIRVHFAENKAPIVGDAKYGVKSTKHKNLMLHSGSLEITHPFKKERICFTAPPPEYFMRLLPKQVAVELSQTK